MREIADEEATEKLKRDELLQNAEAALQAVRREVLAESDRAEKFAAILREAERQRDEQNALRELESQEKGKALRLLDEAQQARLHTSDLLAEAEEQLSDLRTSLAAEHARSSVLASLLTAAESQRDKQDSLRQLEAAEKAKALDLLAHENAANLRHAQLLAEAEAQLSDLRTSLAAEHARSSELASLLTAAESHRDVCQQKIRDLQVQLAHQESETRKFETKIAEIESIATTLANRCEALLLERAQTRAIDFFRKTAIAEHNRLARKRNRFLNILSRLSNRISRLLLRALDKATSKPREPELKRVVQVNTHDLIGGAERTSYDLHRYFRSANLSPTLVVGGKKGTDDDVFQISFKPYDWEPAIKWRDQRGYTEIIHRTPLVGCVKWDFMQKTDIVHIHNMHGKYWNLLTILPLSWRHPLVFTLHDEYLLTGDCCYTYDCTRWKKSCGRCPQIALDPVSRYALGGQDRTRINIWIKRLLLHSPSPLPRVIVTPTEWLARRVRSSPNLHHLPTLCIPNGVDTAFWKPHDQNECRRHLGIPEGKHTGVVVASSLTDRRKGFDIALECIRLLSHRADMHFILVGHIDEPLRTRLQGLPVTIMGYVNDKLRMVQIYGAADFTLALSRVDNLPYMCLESLACGRPIIASEVGGIPEIVNSQFLGRLVTAPPTAIDAVSAIESLVAIPASEKQEMHLECRRSAEARYSICRMGESYQSLYREMLTSASERRPMDLRRIVP